MSARLYLISPPAIELDSFAAKLEEAFTGGDIGAFQLRLKNVEDTVILEAANRLMAICKKHDTAFILNDRPDLAAQIKADGVHLGQDDLPKWPVSRVREMFDDVVVGVSCHDSRHLAMEAGEAGADYVAFGAFYPTKSKSPEALAQYGMPTADILTWWSVFTELPSVAIGGMTPERAAPLVKAGADFIATITAVWDHPQGPAAAVAAFNKAMV